MTRAQILTAIEGISATLKGPGVPNVERLCLNEERRDLRERLAQGDHEPLGSEDYQLDAAQAGEDW